MVSNEARQQNARTLSTYRGKSLGEEFTRRGIRQIPLGAHAEPRERRNVIGFLVSSRSSYMTGRFEFTTDSPLEGDGFELYVRPQESAGFLKARRVSRVA